ncbi:hypothetical protein RHGRI_000918 [Rhododendron griersonianum]|uniref:Uncharacterized protein n=1 Tax=Rhododendron griersonianum TaxID=479676 RepID=A0AAV6LLG6_9ERIC|nr:hypothetical protein RHGRI_000918 [Rhododendron griersonianum]
MPSDSLRQAFARRRPWTKLPTTPPSPGPTHSPSPPPASGRTPPTFGSTTSPCSRPTCINYRTRNLFDLPLAGDFDCSSTPTPMTAVAESESSSAPSRPSKRSNPS